MNILLKALRDQLSQIITNIDTGNSNLNDNELTEALDIVKKFTDRKQRMSKYSACQYLNVSRATFDSYVREGRIPRGRHDAGYKELSWEKKDLDNFIREYRHGN